MIHKEITDKQWNTIKHICQNQQKLTDQGVMIKQQSMEFYLFLLLVAGGMKYHKNMAQNLLHISDYKTGNSKAFGKKFYPHLSNLHINKTILTCKRYS